MNALTETFPAACLVFGLFCGLISLIADQDERRRLYRAALRRRVICEDTRPLQYLGDPVYPWRDKSWFSLNGVESSRDRLERSTRRSA